MKIVGPTEINLTFILGANLIPVFVGEQNYHELSSRAKIKMNN